MRVRCLTMTTMTTTTRVDGVDDIGRYFYDFLLLIEQAFARQIRGTGVGPDLIYLDLEMGIEFQDIGENLIP